MPPGESRHPDSPARPPARAHRPQFGLIPGMMTEQQPDRPLPGRPIGQRLMSGIPGTFLKCRARWNIQRHDLRGDPEPRHPPRRQRRLRRRPGA
jgi:hypothetical protein